MSDFHTFPKIERFEDIHGVITEKVDGTNSLIEITRCMHDIDIEVKFGSRTRYITPENDNAGFAEYFSQFKEKMSKHFNCENINKYKLNHFNCIIPIYGEWYGEKIQRGYGLDHKRFMPFDMEYAGFLLDTIGIPNIDFPQVLYEGVITESVVEEVMEQLKHNGSRIAPGFSNPEGIVIYYPNYGFYLKKTFKKGHKHEQKRNSSQS